MSARYSPFAASVLASSMSAVVTPLKGSGGLHGLATAMVSVDQIFDHQLHPFGLAERAHVGLSVGDPDVELAIVLGHTELCRFVRRHEVEHARGAHGPQDRRGAAAVFD